MQAEERNKQSANKKVSGSVSEFNSRIRNSSSSWTQEDAILHDWEEFFFFFCPERLEMARTLDGNQNECGSWSPPPPSSSIRSNSYSDDVAISRDFRGSFFLSSPLSRDLSCIKLERRRLFYWFVLCLSWVRGKERKGMKERKDSICRWGFWKKKDLLMKMIWMSIRFSSQVNSLSCAFFLPEFVSPSNTAGPNDH